MGDVVRFNGLTRHDIPPDDVLMGAILDPPLDTVIVIGKDQDGSLFLASSTAHMGEVALLLMRAETYLIKRIEEDSTA